MRTLAIRVLTPHFEHKLFLSATPHNRYSESFAALLDNQRFARAMTIPSRVQLAAVMVRRMKNELKLRWDGSRRWRNAASNTCPGDNEIDPSLVFCPATHCHACA